MSELWHFLPVFDFENLDIKSWRCKQHCRPILKSYKLFRVKSGDLPLTYKNVTFKLRKTITIFAFFIKNMTHFIWFISSICKLYFDRQVLLILSLRLRRYPQPSFTFDIEILIDLENTFESNFFFRFAKLNFGNGFFRDWQFLSEILEFHTL